MSISYSESERGLVSSSLSLCGETVIKGNDDNELSYDGVVL
jgi:hypothetical protein